MIDTIVIQSPFLSDEVAKKIHYLSNLKASIDIKSEEFIYKIVTSELKGSWDSSIRVNLKRDMIISEYDLNTRKTYGKLVDTEPYLKIECSLHKLILGHNIYGGSDDLLNQVQYLINLLSNSFDILLPSASEFVITRIDYAKSFKLDDDTIKVFFKGLNNASYPRRRVLKYDTTGIYFPGFYSTLKFYDKGVEFSKHDKKKLKKILTPGKVKCLEKASKNVLRIEIEVKSKKLKSLYNKMPKINEINIDDIRAQWEVEVMRVMKVSKDSRKLYNTIDDVQKVLFISYSDASQLLGTWYRLSTQGYDEVKNSMSKSTFYRHISKLKKVGVVWNHTNIQVIENDLQFYDFNPLKSNLELIDDSYINYKMNIAS